MPPFNNTAKIHCKAGNWATVQQLPDRCLEICEQAEEFHFAVRGEGRLWVGKDWIIQKWRKVPSHGKCSSLLPCSLQAVRDDRTRLLHAGRDREMLQCPGHVLLVTKFRPHTGKWTLPWGTIQIFAIVCPLTVVHPKNKPEILLALTLLWVWLIG